MKYGLDESTIQKIHSVLEKYPHVDKAVLYGSRARGNFRNGSDIDLTLVGKSLTFEDLGKIMDEVDDLLLPYSFDISLYRNIANEDLLEHIKRIGVDFYRRDGG